ncbi:MAG: type II secretion system minor pseudopilin GspH [Xanthomonadales bacterium]|nr:type II secretion system minor pseudopilin GspH [Xanthomonadales bacterium]
MVRPKNRGFTLIELLAVILIMGVVSGVLVLSADLASGQAKVREEARRFAQLMELLCEEAVLQQRELGAWIEPGGYAFRVWESEIWMPRRAGVFRSRTVPDALELQLLIEGKPALADDPAGPPQVVCYSSGELTPFVLTLAGPGDRRLSVTGDALGHIEVEPIP